MITDLLKSRSLFFTAWSKRSGVETRISQCISLKFPDLERSLVINLIQYFLPLANFLHSLTVCAANSLVGQRITALTPPLDPGYQNNTHQVAYQPIPTAQCNTIKTYLNFHKKWKQESQCLARTSRCTSKAFPPLGKECKLNHLNI